jgi:hypothetical protein
LVPPPTDAEKWASVLNLLFWLERDEEFVWLRSVRTVVEEAEREKERAA